MSRILAELILFVAIASHSIALALPPADPDPHRVLIKPIPEKLVVLTFDDGCASGATVVAPILKEFGFGGTFYVCDFDSFATRKDWYLTWRQMKALAEQGFEVGNHTRGHGGGSPIGPFLDMEDQFLANGVPKPKTIAWPIYQVNTGASPDLASNGYTFGRGGHSRAYRPTVDHPFDVPSFGVQDNISVETFISYVHKATHGRIVVITFHGVPDGEHPSVGLEPATFKAMMQYLKDNSYGGIAMRDLAEYIDPAGAAKLPPTANNVKEAGPAMTVTGDKPYVAKDIRTFALPGLPPARISGTSISVTLPYAADITALAPTCVVSDGASVVPASCAARDFTKPQIYTVTGRDGSSRTYTVTVNKTPISTAKDMLTFALPGPISGIISGSRIGVYVPQATALTALAPTFTLSLLATAVPASGSPMDFTTAQIYTVTAQDGSTQVYTVTVVKSNEPNAFTWSRAEHGNWSDASRWTGNRGNGSAPLAAGQPDYILNLNLVGSYAVTNDLATGFQFNQVNLGPTRDLKWAGNPITFVTNPVTGNLPGINVNTRSESDRITIPMNLAADVAVKVIPHGRLFHKGLISGTGGLVLSCPGTNGDVYSDWGMLRIENRTNTYSGGTTINSGQLFLLGAPRGLGTGPVALNRDGDIRLEVEEVTNPLILNGGTLEGGGSWNAPITLNRITKIAGHLSFNEKAGGMSGPGGLTQIGPIGAFGRVNAGEVSLYGANTYTGPTTVLKGTLMIKKAVSLYSADAASWTPEKISIAAAATLWINAGGPGEFTGIQVGTLLRNLTAKVNNNGLMAGSVLTLNTTDATETVTISENVADSKGPGGGAFVLRKSGPGTLRLSGANTYTGQTILDGGTLSVASINRVGGGQASSSLGAPKTPDDGDIVLGNSRRDGDCALVYTGTGETTDRVVDLAGRTLTATFDRSGTGLLKFTSAIAISGYGAGKTIVLTGSTAGAGEIAGSITNPYDRAGAAKTALTKSGTGTWTLSGPNSYTGPTKVTGGVLACSTASSLGGGPLEISAGAKLRLSYTGTCRVAALRLNGVAAKANGTYGSSASPATYKDDDSFSGTGTVTVASPASN